MSSILKEEKEKNFFKDNLAWIIGIAVFLVFAAVVCCFIFFGGDSEDTKSYTFTKQWAEVEKGSGATVAEIQIKDFGTVKIVLFEKLAPKACENFITHAKEGYYDGVKFHRVIDEFMIQGGDPDGTGTGGESIWGTPFEDEITTELMPIRGALCMANAGTNTNGSQFFIVQRTTDDIQYVRSLRSSGVNDELVDYYREVGGCGWLWGKHTVFGQVFEGMDVVDKIAKVDCDSKDMPNEDVIIKTIKIYEY